MAMLNAPAIECDRVNLRWSVPVQKRQQIFVNTAKEVFYLVGCINLQGARTRNSLPRCGKSRPAELDSGGSGRLPCALNWIMGMPSGRVKFFNTDRGYGFIAPGGGGSDVFVQAPQVDGGGAKKHRRLPSGRLQRQNSPSGEGWASLNGTASYMDGPMPASGPWMIT